MTTPEIGFPALSPDSQPTAPDLAILGPGIDAPLPSSAARFFAILLGAAALAVVLLSVASPLFDLDRHSVPKELAVHLTALCALPWLLRDRHRLTPGVVETLLAAFVAWSAASALLADNRWISGRAFGLTYSAFLVFLCARRVARGGAAGWALRGLGLAALLGAAVGTAQAYGFDPAWLTDDRPPGGTFGNRNFLAHFAAITTPLLVLLSVRARLSAGKALWIGSLTVSACAIVLTRSRAGWLGFGAGLGVLGIAWLLTRRETRKATGTRMAGAAAAILAGALLGVLLPNRLEWRSDSPYAETLSRLTDYRSGSGQGRLIQYRNSLRLAAENPLLGVGPGNWFVHYPRVTSPGDRAYDAKDAIPTNPWPSSDWVALLVERGALAVLLALAAAGAAILIAVRRLKADDPETALGAVVLPAILAAAFVTGAFDAVLLLAPPAFFVAAATGLLLPATRAVTARRLRGRSRTLFAGLLLAASAATVLIDSAQLAAIRITRDSTDRATVERALRFDPGNYRLRLLLAGRGACARRVPHARVAARLLPWHAAPARVLRDCGAV